MPLGSRTPSAWALVLAAPSWSLTQLPDTPHSHRTPGTRCTPSSQLSHSPVYLNDPQCVQATPKRNFLPCKRALALGPYGW